jgi:hypothetical protein
MPLGAAPPHDAHMSQDKSERREAVKRQWIAAGWLGAVVALALAALAPAGGAATSKSVAFSASYSGTAAVQVNGDIANISANGTGTGTLGAGKITGTGTGDSTQQPCVPFSGPGSMSGTAGTKLMFTVASGSQGCGDEQGQVFSVAGKANVTKGTGKLAGAHGTLKFTGVYDRGAGTFSVKFKGTLTR